MTPNERRYARFQDMKDNGVSRFASAITAIFSYVNSSLANARGFFEVAKTDGSRDVLMSASAIASANENELLSKLTPAESVEVFAVIGALQQGQAPQAETPEKILLLGQLIAIGYQLSSLPESPHAINSSFDLQIQTDGSVIVEEL